jgi:hypothetical protein
MVALQSTGSGTAFGATSGFFAALGMRFAGSFRAGAIRSEALDAALRKEAGV